MNPVQTMHRRNFLALSAAAGTAAAGLLLSGRGQAQAGPKAKSQPPTNNGLAAAAPSAAADDMSIRPFRVDVPDADLVDLRRRIKATRWPEKETVDDAT